MSKQYEKEFKENAVKYRNDHPDLTVKDCAQNLGIPYDTLNGWVTAHKNKGENAFRGSGNYSSDEANGKTYETTEEYKITTKENDDGSREVTEMKLPDGHTIKFEGFDI